MAEDILKEDCVAAEEETAIIGEEPTAAEEIQVERKKINFQAWMKKPLFWEIAVGGLALLVALIFVLVALSKPANTPKETEDYTPETTAASTKDGPTEPTYLPIDRNPIGVSDFYMEGNYLACLTTPSVVGIDVSEWQGSNINWQQVKDSGVEFVIIRVGGRFEDSGKIFKDDCAQTNYAGASAVGLKVGAYFYSQAITPEEAVEEAQYLLEAVKDWNVEMPLAIDCEDGEGKTRTDHMTARELTDCAIAFCETVKNAGYTPMVYTYTNMSLDRFYLAELDDYPFWFAQYNGGGLLYYDYKIDMWQYTDTGNVPGIPGNVDINLYFPYEE